MNDNKPLIVAGAGAGLRRFIHSALNRSGYTLYAASDGVTALSLLSERPGAIVMVDTEISGLAWNTLLEQVNAHDPHAYVILMATQEEIPALARATSVGSSDFIEKPFTAEELLTRLADAERRRRASDRSISPPSDDRLEDLARRFRDLTEGIMAALSGVIDRSHPETHSHSRRVALRSAALAAELGAELEDVRAIYIAGTLHDLGKVTLAPGLLEKTGPLDPKEVEHIRIHPETSDHIVSSLGLSPVTLSTVRHHHEWYDGSGYPDGLARDAIPFGARVLSICDAYDAMTNDRAYRKALAAEEGMNRLRSGAGSQFDPDMVKVFEAMSTEHGL